jgi:glycosyltransferase involved in cell wall biosynthesis
VPTVRALVVFHMPVFGGPHRTFVRLAAPLEDLGWSLSTVVSDEPGNAARRLRDAGVRTTTMRLNRPRATRSVRPHYQTAAGLVREVRALRRLIVEDAADVVVTVGPENPHGLLAARAAGVPAICQLVGTWLPRPLRPAAMAFVRGFADVVMSVGATVADEHPGTRSLGERLVLFIPPVDLEMFSPPSSAARARAREELGLRRDDLVIGNVSNINPQKDHLNFVRAAAVVRRSAPGARFVILGSTHDTRPGVLAAVLAEAAALGLREGTDLVVRDPGPRVAELAAALDVFWLTSGPRGEGVPTVLGEAMGLGLPVVATDVGGVSEIVDAHSTGRLVPARDPNALAAATLPLLEDAVMRGKLGRAGRARAMELCLPTVAARAHVQAFETALRRRQDRSSRTAGSTSAG